MGYFLQTKNYFLGKKQVIPKVTNELPEEEKSGIVVEKQRKPRAKKQKSPKKAK